MVFFHYEQRTVPYGSLKVKVCTMPGEYKPTNEEVLGLTRELFGLPTREEYEKLDIRLYWHQNMRIFECILTDFAHKKLFGWKYDMDAFMVMEDVKNAGRANNWIATMGNNRINMVYGITLVKVI